MARPRFLPAVKSNKTATFITFPELPGALFVGTPSNADLDHAIYMQDPPPTTRSTFAKRRFTPSCAELVGATKKS